MLESRRQAEQRHARMFGRPANAADIAGSTPDRNGDGMEGLQTSTPTNATNQEYEDIFGEVIPFPELPRGPSPLFARLKDKIEPLGAGIHEPDEDGDGGQEPEYDTPAGDDVAPPPAHYTPTYDVAAVLQQQKEPAQIEQQADDPSPRFDHAMALEFYNAVRPNGLVLGYREGRPVGDANEFEQIAKEAHSRRDHFFFAVNELKPEWREAIARSQRSTYCLRLLTDSRASRCSVNSRRLDLKADSTCTALNVEAPAARRPSIRLFCSATTFCASHTRRWARARGSSSATMLAERARGTLLGRLTLEVRAAAQGSES